MVGSTIKMRKEIRVLKNQMKKMGSKVMSMNNKLARYKERLQTCEHEATVRRNECTLLRNSLSQMRLNLSIRDPVTLRYDVEILNVPEAITVPLTKTVMSVAELLGVTLTERDIVWAERVGLQNSDGDENRPPRPIAVRLVQVAHRLALVIASQLKRLEGPSEIAIHEVKARLPITNQYLFEKTRIIGTNAGWHDVSLSDGFVFVTYVPGGSRMIVRNIQDLFDLCTKLVTKFQYR